MESTPSVGWSPASIAAGIALGLGFVLLVAVLAGAPWVAAGLLAAAAVIVFVAACLWSAVAPRHAVAAWTERAAWSIATIAGLGLVAVVESSLGGAVLSFIALAGVLCIGALLQRWRFALLAVEGLACAAYAIAAVGTVSSAMGCSSCDDEVRGMGALSLILSTGVLLALLATLTTGASIGRRLW